VVRENPPSKVPATDQPLCHFISAPVVTSAPSGQGLAPLTVNAEPGSDWNVGDTTRSVLLSCAQVCCYTEPVFLPGVLVMEIFIWLGVCVVVAVFVRVAAPHHQRLIGNRPDVGENPNWD